MTWQPIETAPKDGPMLVYTASEIICVAVRRGKLWTPQYTSRALIRTPTHWMPLPEPPK